MYRDTEFISCGDNHYFLRFKDNGKVISRVSLVPEEHEWYAFDIHDTPLDEDVLCYLHELIRDLNRKEGDRRG